MVCYDLNDVFTAEIAAPRGGMQARAVNLYETTHSWNSEPQNIDYRTAECRRYSIFAFSKFLLRSDWTLAARGSARV